MPIEFIIETIAEVQQELDTPPGDNIPLPYVILYFVHLINLFFTLIKDLIARVDTQGSPLSTSAQPSSQLTDTPKQGRRASHCTKCHACGHDITSCCTTDLAAMRR